MKLIEKYNKSNILVYILILTVISSGHISLNYEFQSFRKFIFFIILFFIFLHFSFTKKINIPISNSLFLFPLLICFIFSFFYLIRLNYYLSGGWLFTAITIILIWNLNENEIIFFFKKYLAISSVVIFFGLIILYLTNFDIGNFNYTDPYRLSIFKVFANSDSFVDMDTITQKKIYRFSFFLQQSSLVAAYILLPLVIYSLIKRPSIFVLIIYFITIILSFSSTVYIALFFGFIIFIFFNFYSKNCKIIFYSFFICSIFLGLFFYLNFKMQSNYSDMDLDLNNYPFLRISSGAYRLEIIGNQVYHFFTKYFFGFFSNSSSIDLLLLGNLYISSGIRGGFVCVILYFFYMLKVIETIFSNKNINKFASSIIVSCILVLGNFQDFGLSAISGTIFITLLARLIFLQTKIES